MEHFLCNSQLLASQDGMITNTYCPILSSVITNDAAMWTDCKLCTKVGGGNWEACQRWVKMTVLTLHRPPGVSLYLNQLYGWYERKEVGQVGKEVIGSANWICTSSQPHNYPWHTSVPTYWPWWSIWETYSVHCTSFAAAARKHMTMAWLLHGNSRSARSRLDFRLSAFYTTYMCKLLDHIMSPCLFYNKFQWHAKKAW